MTKKPMADAPRDGRVILVGSVDLDNIPMRWDPDFLNPLTGKLGIWVSSDATFTWSEDQPKYGPQYWRDAE